jgi:hypothetical protein
MNKFILGSLLVILFSGFGFLLSSLQKENKRPQQTVEEYGSEEELSHLNQVKSLLQEGKEIEALQIIEPYKKQMSPQWLPLYVEALKQNKNTQALKDTFEKNPAPFKTNEEAALLLAEANLMQDNIFDYDAVRGLWIGREEAADKWFILDADRLIIQGQKKRAETFLKSHTFRGKKDVARLTRLAMLSAYDNPKEAWNYLQEAKQKDPKNPEILSLRAKLLEMGGKNSLSHIEYINALSIDPKNPLYQDQLAEFYIKNKKYPLALEIWKEMLHETPPDSVAIKSYFWNKVTTPEPILWDKVPLAVSTLKPLAAYLISLPEGTFWNSAIFEHLTYKKEYLQKEQATYWLRLIAALKQNHEEEALRLIQFNPFKEVSWNKELELALARVLTYRKNGTFKQEDSPLALGKVQTTQPFFKEIEQIAQSNSPATDKLQALLMSPEVFYQLFLAANWYEAGLALHQENQTFADFPSWTAINYAEALKANRGAKEALSFLEKLDKSSEANYLMGTFFLQDGKLEEGLNKLKAEAMEPTEMGRKAAIAASLAYLQQKKPFLAKEMILNNPSLENEIEGKEALAKIALQEGDQKMATSLYGQIADTSLEAKSYLAKKAFEERDWKLAKKLTEELLQSYPNNATLISNLKQIDQRSL